jgi:hypothetical protein
VPAAVGALRGELLRGHAEDGGQPPDFCAGESSLSAVSVTFGRAHGGGRGPAHQLAELALGPSSALAQDPDVRAENGELLLRNLIGATPPPACHVRPARG